MIELIIIAIYSSRKLLGASASRRQVDRGMKIDRPQIDRLCESIDSFAQQPSRRTIALKGLIRCARIGLGRRREIGSAENASANG